MFGFEPRHSRQSPHRDWTWLMVVQRAYGSQHPVCLQSTEPEIGIYPGFHSIWFTSGQDLKKSGRQNMLDFI